MMHSQAKRECRTAEANIQQPSVQSQWNKEKKCTATCVAGAILPVTGG